MEEKIVETAAPVVEQAVENGSKVVGKIVAAFVAGVGTGFGVSKLTEKLSKKKMTKIPKRKFWQKEEIDPELVEDDFDEESPAEQ